MRGAHFPTGAPLSEVDYTDGMIAIYELNNVRLLQEVFVQAYQQSSQRYTMIRGPVGDPDPFTE